jgi:hypothetical protein
MSGSAGNPRVETLHPVGRGAVHADPRDDASAAGLAR